LLTKNKGSQNLEKLLKYRGFLTSTLINFLFKNKRRDLVIYSLGTGIIIIPYKIALWGSSLALCLGEEYEGMVRRSVKARVGDVVLDIGAHIGYYSLKFAREGGKVVSLEPNPIIYQYLLSNIEVNKLSSLVLPLQLGAWNCITLLQLSVDKSMAGGSSFTREISDVKIPVKCTTVDHLIDTYSIVPTIIKIDTEGAEVEILEGAKETLKRFRPLVILEVHPWREKETIEKIRELKKNLGYKAYKLERFRFPTRRGESYAILLKTSNTGDYVG